MTRGAVVAAFDMSLTGFGVLVGPLAWDGDPKRLRAHTLETLPKLDLVMRCDALARDVLRICEHYRVTHVWAEDLPTHGAFSIVPLAELRGVIRHELAPTCRRVQFVRPRDARRLLYGCQPPRKRSKRNPGGLTDAEYKAWLLEPLKLVGLPLEDDAQGDAFAVFNWACSELGGYTLAGLCAPAGRDQPSVVQLEKEARSRRGRVREAAE